MSIPNLDDLDWEQIKSGHDVWLNRRPSQPNSLSYEDICQRQADLTGCPQLPAVATSGMSGNMTERHLTARPPDTT